MRKLAALHMLAAALACAPGARAQTDAAYFKGRAVNVYVGFGNTGSYDFYGRLVARHIGRHIPGNPIVVVQNMPGAGSTKLANWLASVAPKDGSAIGIVSQTIALDEALGAPGVQYKAALFNWIGRATSSGEVMMTWHTSKINAFLDATRREVVVGTTGPGSPSHGYPLLLNAAASARFRVISGYPSSGDVMLALEKGEVDAASGLLALVGNAHRDWIEQGKLRFILSETVARSPALPDVPAVGELGDTPEDRAMLQLYASTADVGRSFIAPPGLSAERVATLRAAFDAMAKDPDFLADVEKTRAEFAPLAGSDLQRLIEKATQASPAVIARMKRVTQAVEK